MAKKAAEVAARGREGSRVRPREGHRPTLDDPAPQRSEPGAYGSDSGGERQPGKRERVRGPCRRDGAGEEARAY
eukprot:877411-Pleurochrysis_carterae.AAC.1